MASSLSLSDTKGSTSGSGSCVNNNTSIHNLPPLPPPNNFNCLDCYTSFPTNAALMEHQREKGPSHAKMSRNLHHILRGGLNPQSIVIPLQPQSPTIALPTPPRSNQITSRLAPSPPVLSFLHNNAVGNGTSGVGYLRYQPYNLTMRHENKPIGPADLDHGSSSPKRTLDLISQLDPARNLLSQLEQPQSREQSGYGSNVADPAPGTSKANRYVDLNLKLLADLGF